MAKKTAGKGKKFCPHCQEIIGARNTTCPQCKKPIPASTTSKGKKGKHSDTSIRTAIATIKAMGGLNSVKSQIQATEKAIEALTALGGIEGAKEAVAIIEDLRKL